MTSPARFAEIVCAAAVRPGVMPVVRQAPAQVAQEKWAAYRLDAATEQSLSPPERIKRMGRGQEMAILAVQRALADATQLPAKGTGTAVSVGTAWAEEGDEIIFLENLVKFGEKGAKPAYFVNSVKNALASQLALTFGFQGENQTFAHDALSFESALWQGAHLVRVGRVRHALVCGVDALVEFQEIHGHLLGWYGSDSAPLAPLAEARPGVGHGTLPGEGSAAFVLCAPGAGANPVARLAFLRARGPARRTAPLHVESELAFLKRCLTDADTRLADVGLLLLGANGDPALDAIYAEVACRLCALAPDLAVGVYRHLTGDFATASALGFELAVRSVAHRRVVDEVRIVEGTARPVERALLFHVTKAGYHSVMLVAA